MRCASTGSTAGPAAPVLAGVLACSLVAPGCFLWTTRSEGNRLDEQGSDHERRLAAIEESLEAEREALRAGVERASQQVAQLESVLEQARQVLTRNSADMGQEVQGIRQEVGRLEGQIAELRNTVDGLQRSLSQQVASTDSRLQQVAQRAGLDLPLDPSEIPADKGEHFSAAYRAFQGREYSRCRALFRAYVERYATDDQADNAQYWIGASYLQQSQPARALAEFHKVLEQFARGDAVDETLVDLAEAFWQLHACTDARAALQALLQNHPRSPLVSRAQEKLRELRRAPRDYCTS